MRIPTPGEVLGEKYQLEEVLGEGGFGVVMRATTALTGRPVAVKILKPNQGGYEMARAARFLREMATIAKLQSPHTLTLFDYGRTDDGVIFMVCEYVEGEDLLALMARRGRLHEDEVISILHQVLQSLGEAHDLGVLHRDIKPSNIRIFEYEGNPLRVKVLDFGLAKAIEPGAQASLTATNKVIGTPRYMAPEQLTGGPLAPATDLYALGLLATEMLLGRDAAVFSEFVPGRRIAISPADDVSEPLRDIINRLVESDPSTRYQSATDALRALRMVRRGEREQPVQLEEEPRTRKIAPPTNLSPPQRQRAAPVDREDRRLVVVAVVAIACVLASASLVYQLLGTETTNTPDPTRTSNALIRATDPPPEASVRLDLGGARSEHLDGTAGCGRLQTSPRGATVMLPHNYDPDTAYPAIVWLMADQDEPARVPRTEPFQRLIDDEGVIVVVPRGATRGDWRADQVVAVSEIVEEVFEQFCIRTDSVFIMSNGGSGHLAAALSCHPWVSAVAVSNYQRDASGCAPMIALSAKDSVHLPIDGGARCVPFASPGGLNSLEDFEDSARTLHGCRGAAKAASLEGMDCRTWACDKAFESCIVDGGFGWPGTDASAAVKAAAVLGCKEPDPSDVDATSFVWQFFTSRRKPPMSQGENGPDAAEILNADRAPEPQPR